MHQDEFMTNTARNNKERRRKLGSYHRYKTLRAKVRDVVGAESEMADSSPNSVAVGRFPGGNDHFDSESYEEFVDGPRANDDDDSRQDSRQPSPSIREVESQTTGSRTRTDDSASAAEEDLTDPKEWRKFIESVKKEVAGCPPQRSTIGHGPEVLVQEYERSAGARTPISLRRLFPFGKDRKCEEDEGFRRSPRPKSPNRRSRSPIKRSLSPNKFRRRTDSSQSDSVEQVDPKIKARNNFRLPRFPSPGRRSPYVPLTKPKATRSVPSPSIEESEGGHSCSIIKDISEDFVKAERPAEVTKEDLPTEEMKISPEPDNSQPQESAASTKTRKSRKKTSRSSPPAKPIPAEIQELNEQIMKAVGSGLEDDDNTNGETAQSSEANSKVNVSQEEGDDLLSNIQISTTSGIQVKGEQEKEEMLHQTIARRVLSVLLRPSPQVDENVGVEANDAVSAISNTEVVPESGRVIGPDFSPSDDEYNDAPDTPDRQYSKEKSSSNATRSTTMSQKTPNDKIREQLKALKAKTDHMTLKKKAEKSRKKHEKDEKKKTINKKKNTTGKNTRKAPSKEAKSKQATDVDTTTSYESFESFTSKAGGSCFTSTFCCCCFDGKSDYIEDDEGKTSMRDDNTSLYSDFSLDTNDSEWAGRPLPILSPSVLSAEQDDLFDVVEKNICGVI